MGRLKSAVLIILGTVVVGYLFAASTLGFRQWMGERSAARQDYSSAILWYTRALRLVDADENPPLRRQLEEKLYAAYEGFSRWEFAGRTLRGWYAGNEINSLRLEDGVLKVGTTGNDPYLEIQKLHLAPSRKYQFRVRMRCRTGQRAQLYWAPTTDVFSPANVSTFPIECSGHWTAYQVDIPASPEGLGKFRFSPLDAPGEVEIDWIRIIPNPGRERNHR